MDSIKYNFLSIKKSLGMNEHKEKPGREPG